ncbi:MAG: zinc dependent phospholipase C family protein [Flavobacteriales bacterium]
MRVIINILVLLLVTFLCSWGFYGHKFITDWSLQSVPKELNDLLYPYKEELKKKSILPDILKNIEPQEYAHHYIDLEEYDTIISTHFNLDSCVKIETCWNKGVLPFILLKEYNKLINSYKTQNIQRVIHQCGVLSHYAQDLCVPFHTTKNYDGQLTNQHGIHALWETYLPEKFSNQYMLFGLKAQYETNVEERVMQEMYNSHRYVDRILKKHLECQQELKEKTFGFFIRHSKQQKGYSSDFMDCFHEKTNMEIENQLKQSIQLTSDLWYSAWISAGKPKFNTVDTLNFYSIFNQIDEFSPSKYNKRKHE